jgi:molybdopterin/thiamine biosynthesis adenylyltransferase
MPSIREIELDAPSTTTVDHIKRKACQKLGIEYDLTRILCDGAKIDGKRSIGSLRTKHMLFTVDYLWARHLILWGSEGQKRLRQATVLLAGAGAIGNEVAKNLAMLGVKRLLIIDNDTVELSNTSRMIFFDRKSLGLNKAEVLAREVTKKFPYVEATAWTGALEDLSLEHILTADVIVCGLDNVLSRIYLTQVSRKYSIPMVDGGIVGYRGRVQVYVPPEMPCPLCTYPSAEYGRISGLKNPCDGPPEETKIPSLPTTISLVSSIQSQEATKLIIGYPDHSKNAPWPKETGEPLQGILMIDLQYNRYSLVDIKRNKDCVVCGENGLAQEPVRILRILLRDVHDSTDRLHKMVAKEMRVTGRQVMLFLQRRNKTMRIEKGQSLRRLRIGAESIMTAVAKDESNYTEAVVKLVGSRVHEQLHS